MNKGDKDIKGDGQQQTIDSNKSQNIQIVGDRSTVSSILLKQAGELLNVPGIFIKRLLLPDVIYQNNISVPLSSQSLIVSGIRVQYSNILGPYRGGLRIVPDSRTSDLINVGRINTLRAAVAGIPFGGAIGALRLNQKDLGKQDFDKVIEVFVKSLKEIIGPEKDIITPDIRANTQVIDSVVKAYGKAVGEFTPKVVTGKSLELKGTLLYQDAIGLGTLYILEHLIKMASINSSLKENFEAFQSLNKKMRVAIQGFGKVGQSVALALFSQGFQIVGVSDSQGAVFNEQGIDIEQLIQAKQEYGSVVRYSETKILSDTQFYALPAAAFILAARENTVSGNNISLMKAPIVIEIANAAVELSALRNIIKQDKLYIPDILAGIGESIIGFLEYEQNRNDVFYPKAKLTQILEQKSVEQTEKVVELMQKYNVRLELASYALALQKIYNKYKGG